MWEIDWFRKGSRKKADIFASYFLIPNDELVKQAGIYLEKRMEQKLVLEDILKEAYNNGLITEEQANQIWQDMLNKRRKLGYQSFREYLEANP